jgi:hypothetical protein
MIMITIDDWDAMSSTAPEGMLWRGSTVLKRMTHPRAYHHGDHTKYVFATDSMDIALSYCRDPSEGCAARFAQAVHDSMFHLLFSGSRRDMRSCFTKVGYLYGYHRARSGDGRVPTWSESPLKNLRDAVTLRQHEFVSRNIIRPDYIYLIPDVALMIDHI